MTSLGAIIAAARPLPEGGFSAESPPNWAQGRTTYGGLSAALALHAARASAPDLPPLRSAQVAFVGPLAGELAVRPTVLRHGRSAAFIRVEVRAGDTLGLTALFTFMAPRESKIARDAAPRATQPAPAPDLTFAPGPDGFFTGNFDYVDLAEHAPGPAEWLRWARLRERDGVDPLVGLLAIADALPPAALKLLGGFAPLSTLTWMMTFLDPAPATRDGWWLLHADADHAEGGYSSQHMTIWNADGRAIVHGMQAVAIFA